MCARYFLCFQVHTVSPAEDNSKDTVFKTLFWVFSILLSIFENLYVFLNKMLSMTNLGFFFGESHIYAFKSMKWKIVRVLEGHCLFVIRWHVKGRFPVK